MSSRPCPTVAAALEAPPSELDPDAGYRPGEALCLVHNLTFNRHLPVCPDCKESLA